MAENSFLFKKVFPYNPERARKYSDELIAKWKGHSPWQQQAGEEMMKKFVKKRCMHTVWVSDKFREDLPQEDSRTFRILEEKYDDIFESDLDDDRAVRQLLSSAESSGDSVADGAGNAEKDRYKEKQLQQHLLALLYVMNAARNNRPLSVDFIKMTHRILMHNLHTDEGEKITAGEYRTSMVSTWLHNYPDHTCIEENVKKIVTQYEEKTDAVDKYERAGFLLFEVLSLHPFLDGNGRLSRLLWNYSLIRSGLRFPVVPFSKGTSKPYKLYITCITRDRERANLEYVTSMTLISAVKTWQTFIFNLRYESPALHGEVMKWLEQNSINLID